MAGTRLALGAGGVDGDIEPAEALDGLVDQRADIILMTDIGANEFGFRACGAQFGDQGRASVVVTAGDDDPCAPSWRRRAPWRGRCRSVRR